MNTHAILYAEDMDFVRTTLAEAFRRAGHVVMTVKTAEELLEEFSRNNYTLVVTDNRMPPGKKTGLEALRELRAKGSRVEAVLLTGDEIPKEALQGLDIWYVVKNQYDKLLRHLRAAVA